jgi:uncharacterized protein YggE
MNPKIKDYLGIAAIAALIILIAGSLEFVSAYARSAPAAASFAASGEGRVTAVPDTAEFTFGITTEGGTNVTSLQSENTTKTNAAIAYLKSEGVDAKDITTENYNISPRYNYNKVIPCPMAAVSSGSAGGGVAPAIAPQQPCGTPGIVGYTVSQTVRVKVHTDFSKIGDLLAGVAAKGANNVSGLNFTVHDRTALENDARAKAVAEAKEKAEAFARSGHFRLGRILSVQESGSQPPIYYAKLEASGRGAADVGAPSPAIEPGSQEIVSTVTLTYEIR